MAKYLQFGDLHDDLIRDRIVVGIRDAKLSERPQLDPDLTLEKAIKQVRQSEQVKRQQSMLRQGDILPKSCDFVDSVKSHRKFGKHKHGLQKSQSNNYRCGRCGKSNKHSREKCFKCSKIGHYARWCHGATNVDHVDRDVDSPDSDVEKHENKGFLENVGESSSHKWMLDLFVKNVKINFKVDTGADVTVISENDFKKMKNVKLTPSHRKLFGANGRPAIESLAIVYFVGDVTSEDQKYKKKYPKLFSRLGQLEGEYKIVLHENAVPFAITVPRRVQLPLLSKVKKLLLKMEQDGVISRVNEPTDWCAGMVVVPKPDGSVRIFTDLTHLNKAVKREKHPLPASEQILEQLSGSKVFSKLDAKSGFWQVKLAKESRLLTTFMTPIGRFCYERLPFGISSAPEHFQRRMCDILIDLLIGICSMDNVLVHGRNQEEHDKILDAVLKKIAKAGLTLNDKCQFSRQKLKFLGFMIDSEGVHPDPQKVMAISKMPAPTNVSELRFFLGMVNQLGKFSRNLADISKPLRDLLSKKNSWIWEQSQIDSFQKVKQECLSKKVLSLYNPNSATIVSADASSYGLGATLKQKNSDGQWKSVAFASRAMNTTVQKYAQLEKEALAVTRACECFQDFLVGMHSMINTDHKPLVALFGTKSLDELPPRIQRFRLRLMRFSFDISHIPGKHLIIADTLSRAPLDDMREEDIQLNEDSDIYVCSVIDEFPASEKRLQQIRVHLNEDIVCKEVINFCMHGWPDESRLNDVLLPYYQVRDDLTVIDGLLLRGTRLVIPASLRLDILEKIHEGHMGIVKCRSRARSSVWWPYMNKWIKIALLQDTTSLTVINHLKSVFAKYGIPEVIISDNGPQYASGEFSKFAEEYGFCHITTSPCYAQCNGEAERAVQTIKNLLKRTKDPYMALLNYRSTALKNGYSPSELPMGRKLRTKLPVYSSKLIPKWPDMDELQNKELGDKMKQKMHFDKRHRAQNMEKLQISDHAWIKDGLQKEQGVITGYADTPRSYMILTPSGTLRRNRRHLKKVPERPTSDEETESPIKTDVQVEPNEPDQENTEKVNITRSGQISRPPEKLNL
uniref:uncharacterized protein K02A2.6-like n=1 Tax=Styela clava TaxID=7725 RepID=UPI00193A9862|nr:uncharacterized protein K02A2.6-like [Styela clava]